MERQTFVVAEKNVVKIPAYRSSGAILVRAHKKPPIHKRGLKNVYYVV